MAPLNKICYSSNVLLNSEVDSEDWLVEYLKVSEIEIQIRLTNLAIRIVGKAFQ